MSSDKELWIFCVEAFIDIISNAYYQKWYIISKRASCLRFREKVDIEIKERRNKNKEEERKEENKRTKLMIWRMKEKNSCRKVKVALHPYALIGTNLPSSTPIAVQIEFEKEGCHGDAPDWMMKSWYFKTTTHLERY